MRKPTLGDRRSQPLDARGMAVDRHDGTGGEHRRVGVSGRRRRNPGRVPRATPADPCRGLRPVQRRHGCPDPAGAGPRRPRRRSPRSAGWARSCVPDLSVGPNLDWLGEGFRSSGFAEPGRQTHELAARGLFGWSAVRAPTRPSNPRPSPGCPRPTSPGRGRGRLGTAVGRDQSSLPMIPRICSRLMKMLKMLR